MRILVTGGAGFVGRRLVDHLSKHGHRVYATHHTHQPDVNGVKTHKLDVRDHIGTEILLKRVSPDTVIHAAALVNADVCERNPDLAQAVNVDGTEGIVRACEQVGTRVVLLSSSFVFSGEDDLYVEESEREPINVYGETKVAAEDIVRGATVPSLVVRIDQPYGHGTDWQSPSMVEWVLDGLESCENLKVFTDWYNNPVYNEDVAVCVRLLIEERQEGIYHVVGPEYINRYQWARRTTALFGYDIDRIVPVLSADESLAARRPNARLSSTRLVDCTGYVPRGTYRGLQCMCDDSIDR